MKELVNQRATVSFALLVAITVASFWLTVGHGGELIGDTGKLLWASVIVLASVKVRWVMLDFMELRHAPLKLRALFEFWAVVVAGALIITNFVVA
jgi:heme/copper-type cytochrome/quinol oxidase subunit 4